MEKSKQVKNIEVNILRFLCIAHNNTEEQCVFDYICQRSLMNCDTLQREYLKNLYSQADNLLEGLKITQLILLTDKTVKINFNLIKILPHVLDSLEKEVKSREKKIKQNREKVTCAGCHAKRERQLHGFMKCEFCGSDQIIQKENEKQKMVEQAWIDYLKVIGRVRELVNQLKIAESHHNYDSLKTKQIEQAGKKVSPLQQCLENYEKKLKESGKLKQNYSQIHNLFPKIQSNYKWFKKTTEKYQPHFHFPQHKKLQTKKKSESLREKLEQQFFKKLKAKHKKESPLIDEGIEGQLFLSFGADFPGKRERDFSLEQKRPEKKKNFF